MKTTLLHSWHKAAGARLSEFAGFEMPIQYSSAVEEHKLCRRSVGLFDTSHMGRFFLYGERAGNALSAIVSASILDMKAGEARYALLLNENGGVIDDLFIYRLGDSKKYIDPWFIVVNAGNKETDLAWITPRITSQGNTQFPANITLEDLSDKTCMIAVQGPKAVELLDHIVTEQTDDPTSGLPKGAPVSSNVSAIPRSYMAHIGIAGVPVLVGRTGYTGEDGVELYCSSEKVQFLWEAILAEAKDANIEAGAIGLAARDSLRFEAGMPLHGHEISAEISPPEALLSWACDFTKDFIGKEALLAQKETGLKRKLVTINVVGGVPREGYTVLNNKGENIGNIVAGMFCPTTGTYSANAFVPLEYATAGTELAVEIRGTPKEAIVIKRPLYVPVYRRSK
ncbi:MAG: glycine cleavage system aminomethyltransferase GcvT [Treponema sp.]|nr:glycine cleavage system aminomethyltransferase GcvT [Treponema sp.]